ncbi:ATP-grasp fold amidoligase family protein [Butyricimonas synergistica]|uniref:ATP-grasp fold amidoligase family protein n=1 Tax=Butyricimonas synergistica TaxID=544644 RepID=UPI00035F0C4F|nr:ATP-grasp fold amidoligase family protein [Butyricimonas synergistica]
MSLEKYEKHRKKTTFQFIVWKVMVTVYRTFKFYLVPDKIAIRKKFRIALGYSPDFENPISFQEKLQWLKLYDRKEWYSQCVDKYRVREFVKEILGTDKYLIPLYFHSDDFRQLTPENLPDTPFVLKCNHDNNSWVYVNDKSKFDWEKMRSFYRERMSLNFFWTNREWPYKNVKPMVIAEKYLKDKNDLLIEYKYYCFNKEVRIIQYSEANKGHKSFRYLMEDYTPLDKEYKIDECVTIDKDTFKPVCFEEMDSIVRKIAERFEYYIRIDLFNVDDNIYIGELTFFDGAGYDGIYPESWQDEISSYLKLSK